MRLPQTPVGVVRNAYRPASRRANHVAHMAEAVVTMFTTVIVGNSQRSN